MAIHLLASNTLAARKRQIAEAVTARHFHAHPDLNARYGAAGREKCHADTEYHLGYLEQAVARARPEIFADYAVWVTSMLESRGVPQRDLADHLRTLLDVTRDIMPAEQMAVVDEIAAAVVTTVPCAPRADAAVQASVASAFLVALREGGARNASAKVDELMRAGLSLREIYVDVIQPSLHEIGRLWQVNQITVADEHYLTAGIQLVIAQLYPQLFAQVPTRASVVTACVAGELHEIGARMVADLLQFEGFDSHFLGASTPVRDLVDFVSEKRAAVLGLSTTIAPNLSQLEVAVRTLRADPRTSGVKIVVGGNPFARVAGLWQTVGADAFATDARQAVDIFKLLTS